MIPTKQHRNDHEAPDHVFLMDLLESLAEGVLVIDHDGRVLEGNSKAASILGVSVEQVRGRGLAGSTWRFVREDGSALTIDENPITVSLRTHQGCSKVVVGVDAPALARRWICVSTSPFTPADGNVRLIVIFDDITTHVHSEQHLKLMLEVSRLLTSVDNEDEFFQSLCHTLVHVGGYALARIDEAVLDAPHSVNTLYMDGFHMLRANSLLSWSESDPLGGGPIGRALRTGETQVSNDLATDPRFEPWRPLVESLGIHSLVAVPFQLGERRVALAVYGRFAGCFDDATVSGIEEIAHEARFGSTFVRSVQLLEASLDGTISALSLMTESRDPYTAGHQNRVGRLGEQIALRLGVDEDTATLIRQSGALHDVGKIAIPAEILTRPGRLSALEFEMVKRHTVVGGEILTQASLPWPIAEVALHHHERLDGSGYPDGLRGDEISLAPRVIMVADVVEAMTQHRPYRPALGIERALREVEEGSGSRFDADAVAACRELFDGGYQFSAAAEFTQLN